MTKQEAFDKTRALSNDFMGLTFNVRNDDDLRDCRNSARVGDVLWALSNDILTESLFAELCDEVEDNKSLFFVQKKSKNFFEEFLLVHIDSIITMSKQVQFHDYRAINLQREARDLSQELREKYVEIYR